MKASFDGIIARVLVDNFQNVQIKQPILSLQNLAGIEIQASLPESRMARLRPQDGRKNLAFRPRVFDFLPDRALRSGIQGIHRGSGSPDADLHGEVSRWSIPSDATILPGMTCTLKVEPLGGAAEADAAGFEVPLDAVPIDEVGQYYVWLVAPAEGEVFTG